MDEDWVSCVFKGHQVETSQVRLGGTFVFVGGAFGPTRSHGEAFGYHGFMKLLAVTSLGIIRLLATLLLVFEHRD